MNCRRMRRRFGIACDQAHSSCDFAQPALGSFGARHLWPLVAWRISTCGALGGQLAICQSQFGGSDPLLKSGSCRLGLGSKTHMKQRLQDQNCSHILDTFCCFTCAEGAADLESKMLYFGLTIKENVLYQILVVFLLLLVRVLLHWSSWLSWF